MGWGRLWRCLAFGVQSGAQVGDAGVELGLGDLAPDPLDHQADGPLFKPLFPFLGAAGLLFLADGSSLRLLVGNLFLGRRRRGVALLYPQGHEIAR